MNDARVTLAVMGESSECVREMIGIIPARESDPVEEYHRHLVEKYDSAE